MKYLAIIRHAKSSWKATSLPDMMRPLNERGKQDAIRIAKALKQLNQTPDYVLCSNAKRTIETLTLFQTVLTIPASTIEITDKLYLASHHQHLLALSRLDNRHHFVFDIAHHPGVCDLTNYLCDENITHFPTCAVALIELQIDHWEEMVSGTGILQQFLYPKMLD